jgi:hypothetical protein
MATPLFQLIASALFGQAPGPIVPTVSPPDLPAAYALAAMEKGLSGSAVVQACQILDEGVPLCFRVEREGRRDWFSLGEAEEWGLSLEGLATAVRLESEANPFVEVRVEDGGHWWQVEAVDGREALVFLHPIWLERVGPNAVVAAPASGLVLAWESGDEGNDKIMAVGVRRIFEEANSPVSPKIFRHTKQGWKVWGEAVLPAPEAQAD